MQVSVANPRKTFAFRRKLKQFCAMKIESFWRKKIRAAVVCTFFLALLTRGQDATLTVTVASDSLTAGDSMSAWMTALNPTGDNISWTFPPEIKRKFISPQGTFDGSMSLSSTETNVVVIAPGAFARREYVSAVPDSISGQVVLEFPGLDVNRTVLDIAARTLATSVPAKMPPQKTYSAFTRLVKEAEPEEPGKGSEPGNFFKEHISGYEPMYFIAGTKSPNAKFQISFAYQLLNNDGPLAEKVPALKGFHIAYTQTSLWDWNAPSAPFYDTNYKPEFFYSWENVTRAQPTNWFQLDLEGSLKHESNGKDGAASRSLNIAYFRPSLTVGRDAGLQLTLQPRVWTYLGSLGDNPDIADYRGYADLRAVVGWKRGLELSALGRMGKDANHGSVQLDLTYPTMRIFGSFSLYLDVQYFTGYGESLLGYNQKSEELRVGFSLFR
jgi:outer membrane phospholipase A